MKNDEQVLISLRKIIRAIDLHSKKLEKASGLTGPQILVLKSILEHDKVTPGSIARDVNLSQATITSILDRLQKKDYIRRERSDDDKRKVLISPTEKGDRVYQNAPTLLQENFTREFSQLKDWEQSQIIASLQRVASMMNAEEIDASPILIGSDIHDPHGQAGF
jgi:DNA-binding MarR family transcriptional regulator